MSNDSGLVAAGAQWRVRPVRRRERHPVSSKSYRDFRPGARPTSPREGSEARRRSRKARRIQSSRPRISGLPRWPTARQRPRVGGADRSAGARGAERAAEVQCRRGARPEAGRRARAPAFSRAAARRWALDEDSRLHTLSFESATVRDDPTPTPASDAQRAAEQGRRRPRARSNSASSAMPTKTVTIDSQRASSPAALRGRHRYGCAPSTARGASSKRARSHVSGIHRRTQPCTSGWRRRRNCRP